MGCYPQPVAGPTTLKVYGGDVNSPTELFRGKVTALEARYPQMGPPELVVLSSNHREVMVLVWV